MKSTTSDSIINVGFAKRLYRWLKTAISGIRLCLAARRTSHIFSALSGDIVLPIYRVGELYCYDTFLPIGAFLDRLPSKVYLHAVRSKARKLYPLRHRESPPGFTLKPMRPGYVPRAEPAAFSPA